MTETPESHRRIAQMQIDIEELKHFMQDEWHEKRDVYRNRVLSCLDNNKAAASLYLAIDGSSSIQEIESSLNTNGEKVAHATLWRATKKMEKAGLITKCGMKYRSPIYKKQRWASVLHIDEDVKARFQK